MNYKVLIDTLNHNGRKRVPGELIEMAEADAAALIKIGVIEMMPEKSPKPDDNGGDDDPDNNQSDSAAGSDAPKTGKKESKPKAK